MPGYARSAGTGTGVHGDAPDGWYYQFTSKREGTPASINGVVQGKDGFLWIAAQDGLFRYDGVKFERVSSAPGRYVQSEAIDAITALPNGDVWLGHDWGGLSLVREGRQTRTRFALPGYIVWMGAGPNGTAWAFSNQHPNKVHIARFDGKQWRLVTTEIAGPGFRSGAADMNGNLWMLKGKELVYLIPGRGSALPVATVDPLAQLATAPDGSVWLMAAGKLTPLLGGMRGQAPMIGPVAGDFGVKDPAVFIFDKQRNIWLADAAGHLREFKPTRRSSPAIPDHWQFATQIEASPFAVGFSDRAFIDAEENLWLLTNAGLGKIQRTAFARPAALGAWAGWQTDQLAIKDGLGAIWITRRGDLVKIGENGAIQPQPFKVPSLSTPCASRTDGLWVLDGKGYLRVVGGPARRALPVPGTKVFGKGWGAYCIEDGAGRVWVSDIVLHLATPDGLKEFPLGHDHEQGGPCTFAIDRQGRLLVYLGRGNLYRTDGKTVDLLWRKDDMALGFIEVMYQGDHYLYLGGDRGLVRYDGHSFQLLSRDRYPYLAAISGITQTSTGETWLFGSDGVVRLKTSELDHAFDDPNYRPHTASFGVDEGLVGENVYWNTSSLVSDRRSRIYAMTGIGLTEYEGGRLAFNKRPPPVEITSVRVDGREQPLAGAFTLPGGITRLQITYTGISLVNPSRVRFRYRLFGFDRGWVDAGTGRSATYTSLEPGSYRFQVIAANNDNVWNRTGADIQFSITPTFMQSWVFKALCAVVVLAIALLLHWLRSAYLAQRFRNRMNVQLSERERIARTLHDTLLQNVQGLVTRFHSLSLCPHLDGDTKKAIDETLNEVETTLVTSREQVAGLRRARIIGLSRQIEATVEKICLGPAAAVAVTTDGEERLLEPIVSEEGASIACEAITNAIRHSCAEKISARIIYRPDRLIVRVQDDGKGIDRAIVRNGGRDGHFGLLGMRERAERAGGRLEIASATPGGTTVTFEVSGRVAYLRARSGPLWTRKRMP